MNLKQKVLICTLKRWNLDEAARFKALFHSQYEVMILSEKEQLNIKILEHFKPDYLFFPHWSYIIPEDIYDHYPCIVFHMTDLPFGRGGSPLQNLIARGIHETVISAIRVTQVVDGGDIYLKWPLHLDGSAQEIYQRACQIIFQEMIPHILTHHPEPVPQVGEITTFRRRTPMESILPQNTTSQKLYDHIRMLDAEGYPAAFIQYGVFKICFKNARLDGANLLADVTFIEDPKTDKGK